MEKKIPKPKDQFQTTNKKQKKCTTEKMGWVGKKRDYIIKAPRGYEDDIAG